MTTTTRLLGTRYLHPTVRLKNHEGDMTQRHRGCSDPECLEVN